MLNTNFTGIIGALWQLAKGAVGLLYTPAAGPTPKSIDLVDANGATLINGRARDPDGTDVQQIATAGWVLANSGDQGTITIPVGAAAATYTSTASIPANAVVQLTSISVTGGYAATTTIAVGRTGSLALLAATTNTDATAVAETDLFGQTAWGASALPVKVTVGGAGGGGAATVLVSWNVPTP